MFEKLEQRTPNFTGDHIVKIAEMFPHCLVEAEDENGKLTKAIDFDLLRQELTENIVDGPKERYRLDWPGKRASLVAANTPITKTLRPAREESVDFDTTQNLYIEGDNLDALKLLQKSYLGAVKMIYIDPPYNTGKDFVYKDNFARSREEELKESGQIDKEGGRLVSNPESNGRFHSDWLSMMYPRLRLARNLLRDDGVIFISIDDNEVHNLRKICDEVFGEENFVGEFIWKKKSGGANDAKHMVIDHEYITVFSKSINKLIMNLLDYNEENLKLYNQRDEYFEKRGPYRRMLLMQKGLSYSESLTYEIKAPDGTILTPDKNSKAIWRWSKDKFLKALKNGFIEFVKDSNTGEWKVYTKQYLYVDYDDKPISRGAVPRSIISDIDGRRGTRELQKIFGRKIFENPKPKELIYRMIEISTKPHENDHILDFFSGSATTAHAVMQLNAEDSGNRKFIMVQLPEPTDEKSEAYKADYKTIAEIGKERIRRAGRKIKEENVDKEGIEKLDIGFRVLKIDSSNMKDVYFTPDEADRESLFDTVDHIKADRSAEDLLFGVLVDWGVDLTLPIRRESIESKTVYFVGEDALAACFDDNLDETFLKTLAGREVLRVVFKESGFKDDAAKINAEQIFAQLSPGTDVRVI